MGRKDAVSDGRVTRPAVRKLSRPRRATLNRDCSSQRHYDFGRYSGALSGTHEVLRTPTVLADAGESKSDQKARSNSVRTSIVDHFQSRESLGIVPQAPGRVCDVSLYRAAWRAFAVRTAVGCVLFFYPVVAICGGEAPAIPNTPDGTVIAVIQGLADNKPDTLWAALPASYQKEMTALVHLLSEKVDAEVYRKGSSLARKLVTVLRTKKEFILDGMMYRWPVIERTRVSEGWETIVCFVETVAASELSNSASLKSLDIVKFLRGTGRDVMKLLAEVYACIDGREFKDEVRGIAIAVLSAEGDKARLELRIPGKKRTSALDLVRVEGMWLPKDLADSWPEYVVSAKKAIESLDKERTRRVNAEALAIISELEATLDVLAKVEKQAKFAGFVEGVLRRFREEGLALFIPPSLSKQRSRAKCMGRLRILGQLCLVYAEAMQYFPIAREDPPAACESLQLLVNAMKDARDPMLYVCPGSGAKPVTRSEREREEDESFTLTKANVSYAWRTKLLRATGTRPVVLACDASLDNHGGEGVCVLYSDGRVSWVSRDELGAGGLEAFFRKHSLGK